MKKILIAFVSLCLISTAGAMASGNSSEKIQDSRQTAKQLIDALFFAYSPYNSPGFEDLVSLDFTPPRGEFINGVQNAFYGNQILEMNCFVQSALGKKNRLYVDFRWEKKMIPRVNGQVTLRRGRARFIFNHEDGQWRLAEIKGQNPFTT